MSDLAITMTIRCNSRLFAGRFYCRVITILWLYFKSGGPSGCQLSGIVNICSPLPAYESLNKDLASSLKWRIFFQSQELSVGTTISQNDLSTDMLVSMPPKLTHPALADSRWISWQSFYSIQQLYTTFSSRKSDSQTTYFSWCFIISKTAPQGVKFLFYSRM